MKNIILLLLLLSCTLMYSQKKEQKVRKNNMPTSTNFLDMQIEVLKDITKDSIVEGIDFSKITNFKDLLKQAKDLTPKEKKYYKSLYELQAKTANQQTKDSIRNVISKSILKEKK